MICKTNSIIALIYKFAEMHSFFWRFITEEATEFLNCELSTKTGKLKTNQSFLFLSSLIWPLLNHESNENISVILPNHSKEEIKKELGGYILSNEEQSVKELTDEHQIIVPPESDINDDYFSESNLTMSKVKLTAKSRQSKSFQCEVCGKEFNNSKKFRMHRFQVHSTKEYCRLKFSWHLSKRNLV